MQVIANVGLRGPKAQPSFLLLNSCSLCRFGDDLPEETTVRLNASLLARASAVDSAAASGATCLMVLSRSATFRSDEYICSRQPRSSLASCNATLELASNVRASVLLDASCD